MLEKMPRLPRFPHGLRKKPTDMSGPEIFIFAVLASSIGAGVYQLATSPWSETSSKQDLRTRLLSFCPMPLSKKADSLPSSGNELKKKDQTTLIKSDNGATTVEFGK
mmetsp:Transcript_4119/g.5526  ORF Transcript_4119/g.5526 Transcript_4119/m.5526 type:complete len:107 (+) Transcript_4119:53-373(+)